MATFIGQAAEADRSAPAESKSLTISEKLTAKMEEAGPTTLLHKVHFGDFHKLIVKSHDIP